MKELFDILLNATKEYVAKNIYNNKHRNYYIQTINTLYYDVSTKQDLTKAIEHMKFRKANFVYRKSLFYDYKKYGNMAYDHVIDVAESLNTRFVVGGERAYHRGIK